MPTETTSPSGRLSMVLVRTGDLLCALPIASVIETLRSPPITAISGTPECVRGVAMIRGATVAIVDLGILLGSGSAKIEQARLVTLKVGARVVGLVVDSIIGVRDVDPSVLSEVPPMFQQAHPEVFTAVGMLDRELLMVLDGSRIITEQELDRIEGSK